MKIFPTCCTPKCIFCTFAYFKVKLTSWRWLHGKNLVQWFALTIFTLISKIKLVLLLVCGRWYSIVTIEIGTRTLLPRKVKWKFLRERIILRRIAKKNIKSPKLPFSWLWVMNGDINKSWRSFPKIFSDC